MVKMPSKSNKKNVTIKDVPNGGSVQEVRLSEDLIIDVTTGSKKSSSPGQDDINNYSKSPMDVFGKRQQSHSPEIITLKETNSSTLFSTVVDVHALPRDLSPQPSDLTDSDEVSEVPQSKCLGALSPDIVVHHPQKSTEKYDSSINGKRKATHLARMNSTVSVEENTPEKIKSCTKLSGQERKTTECEKTSTATLTSSEEVTAYAKTSPTKAAQNSVIVVSDAEDDDPSNALKIRIHPADRDSNHVIIPPGLSAGDRGSEDKNHSKKRTRLFQQENQQCKNEEKKINTPKKCSPVSSPVDINTNNKNNAKLASNETSSLTTSASFCSVENSESSTDSDQSSVLPLHPTQQSTSMNKTRKSNEAVLIVPPEFVTFSETGQVIIAECITKSVPQLVKKGCTDIYLIVKRVTKPTSQKPEDMVLKVNVGSSPLTYSQTELPSSKKGDKWIRKKSAPTPEDSSKVVIRRKRGRPPKNKPSDSLCQTPVGASTSDKHLLGLSSSTRKGSPDLNSPDAASKLTRKIPTHQWSHEDVSTWLQSQGLTQFMQLCAEVDGAGLMELADLFSRGLEWIQKYLQDGGFILSEKLKFFAALRALSQQVKLVSKIDSQYPSTDMPGQLSGDTKVVRKRGRPSKVPPGSSPSTPSKASSDQSKTPLTQWSTSDVDSWLKAHKLKRFAPDFLAADGHSLLELVQMLRTDSPSVYRLLYDTGFSLAECLRLCAFLRSHVSAGS